VSQEINRYKVLEIMIDAATSGVCLTVGEGYDADEVFVEVSRRQVMVAPGTPELVAVMTAPCDPEKDLYTMIRDSSYALLSALGELPDGTPA
jgi:hypothetical protein